MDVYTHIYVQITFKVNFASDDPFKVSLWNHLDKKRFFYGSDTQICLAISTFLQSLAPTLIKLTYLWLSNDPEDID